MNERVRRYSLSEFAEQYTYPIGPGTYVGADDYDALHAEAEARLEREQIALVHAMDAAHEAHRLRQELGAARVLLRDAEAWMRGVSGHYGARNTFAEKIDAFLTATPAPEVRQALSAENQRVVPPEPIIAPPHPLAAPEVRHEQAAMQASNGEGFSRFRVAEQAEQGERQEAVAHRLINGLGEVMTDWHDGPPPDNFVDLCGQAMKDVRVELVFSTPQPGQDVRALVEALEEIVKQYPNPDISHVDYRVHACQHAEQALDAHRQAQQGGSHEAEQEAAG